MRNRQLPTKKSCPPGLELDDPEIWLAAGFLFFSLPSGKSARVACVRQILGGTQAPPTPPREDNKIVTTYYLTPPRTTTPVIVATNATTPVTITRMNKEEAMHTVTRANTITILDERAKPTDLGNTKRSKKIKKISRKKVKKGKNDKKLIKITDTSKTQKPTTITCTTDQIINAIKTTTKNDTCANTSDNGNTDETSKKNKNSCITPPITPPQRSIEPTYVDTDNIKRICRYCGKTKKSIIHHLTKCSLFKASKDYPTYIDEDDKTRYEVTNEKINENNKVISVIKDRETTNMRSIKKSGKLITQTVHVKNPSVEETPTKVKNKRLNSQSPIQIIQFNKYLNKGKRNKEEDKIETKTLQKITLEEVKEWMNTTIKSKQKSKIIKRLNSQSPLRPLLRKCNQKKRNKQDDEATLEQKSETDKTNSPQRSSTPELHDFEDVSDFDN